MADDARRRRLAENEAAFRAVNERVGDLADELDVDSDVVCECARIDCAERLRVPAGEYERVRAHPRRFIVAAGHEQPEVERVIDERGGWLVVEKTGEAGETAAEHNPRSPGPD